MKYIIAIIQPSKLEAVHEALKNIDIAGMTVSEVQGYGRQMGKSEMYRGAEYTVNFIPKTKIEIAVDKSAEEAVVVLLKQLQKQEKSVMAKYLFWTCKKLSVFAPVKPEAAPCK